MRHVSLFTLLLALMSSQMLATTLAQEPNRPFGLQKRIPWTSSQVQGSPDPPAPYRIELAFPNLKFNEGLAMATAPGLERLFVVERKGKIHSFANDPATDQSALLLDLETTLYGLALHPKFVENGHFYVVYIPNPAAETPTGTRLSRFTATRHGRLQADRNTEKVILEWPNGGHNGGCLKFGPDGYLYIVCGDGSGIADELQTGQHLGDLLASILRIDVDRQDPGLAYAIPKDNPFVGRAGARGEIWAYGLRQAWKMSFDRQTGELWTCDVGQDLWESVHRIERGGNYGWSVKEASHPFRPERPVGPTPIIAPIAEHHHADFRSITGGFVYRGKRLPDLAGEYVYGDYDTGRVWGLKYESGQVTRHRELVDTSLRIVDFAEDNAGEIYLLDFIGGAIHRLVKAPATVATGPFPRLLSQTGLFASTKDHTPAPGVIPYSVNSPLWSDHAHKERFLAIPGNGQIDYNAVEYPQPAPGAPRGWRFPNGTVAVKTFFLDLEPGNPQSRRRLETRILHFEQLAGTEEIGDQVWRGYTYVWNDAQTDAELLEAKGADRKFTIKDAAHPGGMREQVWHFPSRAECTLCHTMPAKFVLGLNTLQLNRDHDYGGVIDNQLRSFEHVGLFKQPLPDAPEKLPRLPDYADTKVPLADRARSYLHSNCSHCHMKWGGGNAEFQLLATQRLDELGIVGAKAGHGLFNIGEARILVPGKPEQSLLWVRMQKLGLGRMPHVGSNVVDERAVKLLKDWIASLPL